MFISDFAIKRPVVTSVTMMALVVFGLFALLSLDTDEFPEVEAPFIFISVPYPGASPDIVEREVVDPIEEAVAGISGVDQIQSQALDGFGSVQVIFLYGVKPQQAAQDIRDAISQIRGDLPQEREEPILARFDPNDQPIVSLTLSSRTLSPAELTRIADPGITRDLRGIPGVAEVQVAGGVERELSVEVDPSLSADLGRNAICLAQACGGVGETNVPRRPSAYTKSGINRAGCTAKTPARQIRSASSRS